MTGPVGQGPVSGPVGLRRSVGPPVQSAGPRRVERPLRSSLSDLSAGVSNYKIGLIINWTLAVVAFGVVHRRGQLIRRKRSRHFIYTYYMH